jgi:DME family drug/metabolite transporter
MTGLTFACVFLFNNRLECDTPVALFIGQVGTFLIGLPYLIFVRDWQPLPILAICILGVFQLGLAYLCFGIGIQTTKPLSANLLAMVEPIANPIRVFLVVHEIPGLPAIAGAVIVLAAVLYLNINKLKQT